jgi:uncharacterized small protein (DUF1192 family)
MDWDDVRKPAKPSLVMGEDLAKWSLAELEARIASLRQEIARTEAEITRKKAHNQAAAALFKSE